MSKLLSAQGKSGRQEEPTAGGAAGRDAESIPSAGFPDDDYDGSGEGGRNPAETGSGGQDRVPVGESSVDDDMGSLGCPGRGLGSPNLRNPGLHNPGPSNRRVPQIQKVGVYLSSRVTTSTRSKRMLRCTGWSMTIKVFLRATRTLRLEVRGTTKHRFERRE